MNLQSILYVIFILSKTFGENSEVVISQSGVEGVTPCGIGLKFYVELNNTSNKNDYEVQVSADQCCLEADGSLDCDVLEIIGDCVGFVPRGAIKTVRMVAPIPDPIQRRGYCILYLDSKCNYNGRNMRDTIKINFDTRIGNINKIIEANIKPCKNIDEDPLNDCNPVDCDSFYNNRKPFYNKKYKRCVQTPPCISDMDSEIPNVIYDPISNRCVVGKAISKRDVDYIKDLNARERKAKDVLIIKNYDKSPVENVSSDSLNNAIDMVPMCKKCNKLHILSPPRIAHIKKECFPGFLCDYFVTNKYTVIIIIIVITIQCCFIGAMIYCFTKSCACCKQKKVIRKFFNYRQDASVTTPLIGTSNMDTETDFQFESESTNVDKKIKCYKACQKERTKSMKMSMSDDILSKCLNRRDWSRQNKAEVIPEMSNKIVANIDKIESNKTPVTETKKSETKVVFEDEKPKVSDKISKKVGSIPKCLNKEIIEREAEDIEEFESSEKELQCHSYNNRSSNMTGFKPRTVSKSFGYFHTEKRGNISASSDKEAQASFSNDSIDDLLSEKGIYFAENISKYNFSTESNKTSTPVSSKTSKNNFVKNVLSLLHKKSKTNSSDPGAKVSENSDVKLIHMSKASIYTTSNESECIKCIKPKDSRTSL